VLAHLRKKWQNRKWLNRVALVSPEYGMLAPARRATLRHQKTVHPSFGG
jgi:hypothetical protein